MSAAIRVEMLKLARSPVGVIGSLALVVGIFALLGGITAGVAGGNPELIAQAGPASTLDWEGLLGGAAQISSVASMLGFGIVLAWMFGREFAEGTITGLFALPVSRGRIALAKLIVYALWVSSVAFVLTFGILVLGLVVGYGWPNPDAWSSLARLWALLMLTGVIATPTAWIATITRSLLAGVGATIALVVIAQVGSLMGAEGWMPLAAPALWAQSAGTATNPAQLTLSIGFGAAGAGLAITSWARLQLNR